jgi:AbiU2
MSEEDARNRLRALVKAVADDLWIAAATFEVYAPTAFDASLIEKVNEREVYPAFNVVSEALEATAISALCRIWDKTGDAARIAEIEKLLRRRPDLARDGGALRRWLGGVEMVEKSEELQALRDSEHAPRTYSRSEQARPSAAKRRTQGRERRRTASPRSNNLGGPAAPRLDRITRSARLSRGARSMARPR